LSCLHDGAPSLQRYHGGREEDLSLSNIVGRIIESEEYYKAVLHFCGTIKSQKEDERER